MCALSLFEGFIHIYWVLKYNSIFQVIKKYYNTIKNNIIQLHDSHDGYGRIYFQFE